MRQSIKVLAAMAVLMTAAPLLASEPQAPRFGTGVYLDEGQSLHPGDFSVITEGKAVSMEKDVTPGGTSVAGAIAAADGLVLGILLEDNESGRTGGAQAASGYTVDGIPEGSVVAGLMLSIDGKAVAKGSGGFGVTVTALDYHGNFLAELTFTGERIVDEKTGAVFEKDSYAATYCPDAVKFPGLCNDPIDPVKRKTLWLSGAGTSANVPLFLPVAQGSGLIVELWGSTDNAVSLDFQDAVKLTGSLPSGVVINFASGQSFRGQ